MLLLLSNQPVFKVMSLSQTLPAFVSHIILFVSRMILFSIVMH